MKAAATFGLWGCKAFWVNKVLNMTRDDTTWQTRDKLMPRPSGITVQLGTLSSRWTITTCLSFLDAIGMRVEERENRPRILRVPRRTRKQQQSRRLWHWTPYLLDACRRSLIVGWSLQCGFMYRLLVINSWNKTDNQSELPSLIIPSDPLFPHSPPLPSHARGESRRNNVDNGDGEDKDKKKWYTRTMQSPPPHLLP